MIVCSEKSGGGGGGEQEAISMGRSGDGKLNFFKGQP